MVLTLACDGSNDGRWTAAAALEHPPLTSVGIMREHLCIITLFFQLTRFFELARVVAPRRSYTLSELIRGATIPTVTRGRS
eukprot:1911190-Rhodomonas_salina.2